MDKQRWKLTMGFLLASGLTLSFATLYDPIEIVHHPDYPYMQRIRNQSPHFTHLTFKPNRLICNAHFQSIYTGIRTALNTYYVGPVQTKRQLFDYKDGGTGIIEYKPGINGGLDSDRPLVIIIPGIMSTMEDNYIRTLTKSLDEAGYNWAVLHYRGIGSTLTSEKGFNPGDCSDQREMVKHILANKRTDQVFLYGASLGGNLAANIISEPEFKDQFKAAAIIQPSLDLAEATDNLRTSLWGFYDFWFMKCFYMMHERVGCIHTVERLFTQASKQYGYGVDFRQFVSQTWFASDMSRKYPQFIYQMDSLEEACKKYSSINRFHSIDTPTLLLKAEDDPVVGQAAIDEKRVLTNPNILLVKTQMGGHLGYYESLFAKQQFFNRPIIEYLNAFR